MDNHSLSIFHKRKHKRQVVLLIPKIYNISGAKDMHKVNHQLIHNILVFAGLISKNDLIEISVFGKDDNNPQCYLISNNGEKICKIRFPSKGHEDAIKTEQAILKLLANDNIHGIPKIISHSQVNNIEYLLVSYIEGNNLSFFDNTLDKKEIQDITEQLFFILKKIHSYKCSSYNDYRMDLSKDWNEYICFKLQNKLIEFLTNSRQKEIFMDKIYRLSDYELNLIKNGPTLIHFDLKPENIIYNQSTGEISLIDFEMARYAELWFEYSKADFCTFLYPSQTYQNKIFPNLLQKELGIPIDEFREQPTYNWYMLYHWVAYINYLNCIHNTVLKTYYNSLSNVLDKLIGGKNGQ